MNAKPFLVSYLTVGVYFRSNTKALLIMGARTKAILAHGVPLR